MRFVWSIYRQQVPLKICKDCKTKSYIDVSGMFCPAFPYPYFQFIFRETRFTEQKISISPFRQFWSLTHHNDPTIDPYLARLSPLRLDPCSLLFCHLQDCATRKGKLPCLRLARDTWVGQKKAFLWLERTSKNLKCGGKYFPQSYFVTRSCYKFVRINLNLTTSQFPGREVMMCLEVITTNVLTVFWSIPEALTFDLINTEVSLVKMRSFLINLTNARNELSLEKVKVFNGQFGTRPYLLLGTVYQYNEPCHSGLISKYPEAIIKWVSSL